MSEKKGKKPTRKKKLNVSVEFVKSAENHLTLQETLGNLIDTSLLQEHLAEIATKPLIDMANRALSLISEDITAQVGKAALNAIEIQLKKIQLMDIANTYTALYGTGESLSTRNWLEDVAKSAGGDVKAIHSESFADDLAEVTGMNKDDLEVIDVATTEIITPTPAPENPSPEIQNLKNEIQILNSRIVELQQELSKLTSHQDESNIQPSKSKRGRKTPTDAEKHKALKEWDGIDKSITSITLEEFLEQRFGTNGGVLNVAVSTFHGWRDQLRKKGKDI